MKAERFNYENKQYLEKLEISGDNLHAKYLFYILTNLIDIEKFFSHSDCQIVFSSGFSICNNFITRLIESIPIIRYCFPSCFLIAKKNS